jgi:phage terminase large subunit-like protein
VPGLWQPDLSRKSFRLSAGGARFAFFAHSMVRQTKGRYGSGYGPDGLLGAPLTLEWWQLQCVSEGLKTKPSQWLTVRRDDPLLWDKVTDWVTSENFGSVGGPRFYKEWYLQMSKKTGKALDLRQRVSTPIGWRDFGDLEVGDSVFDEHGKPTRVVAVSPVWEGRPCYRMKLTDGGEVISDRDHEWVTEDPAGRRHAGRHAGVVETREIAETLKYGSASNHAIVYPGGPLEFEPLVDVLPVPPYTLGAWLGDGASAAGVITGIDEQIIERVRADGFDVRKGQAKQRWGVLGLLVRLREAGVLGRKHIPEIYKRASAADRMELLRGLMDTDGTVAMRNRGTAELALSDPVLAADAIELLRGLGFAPSVTVNAAYLKGARKKDRTRIAFRCWPELPVPFHLSRKVVRVDVNSEPTRRERSRRRHVISCEPCESVPVRCIEVENPAGLFLIGDTHLITHNSTLSSSLGIYFTGFDGEPGAEVYALAASKGQARTVFDQARHMVTKSPRLMDEFVVYKDVIEHAPSGSIFRVLSADSDYNEGYNPHAVILDELHAHKDRAMYDAMTSHLHTGAREDPIAVTITNAGTDEDSICYEVYSQAKAVIDGMPDARTDLYAFVPELEANEIYDKTKWKKVMPSSWQTIPQMEEAQRKFPAYVFERRYLNVWGGEEECWLPYTFWGEAGEDGLVVPRNVPICVAADMGMTKDTSALAWAGVDQQCECGSPSQDVSDHADTCPYGLIYVGSHIWGIKPRDRAKAPPCHELLTGDRFPIKLLKTYVEDELRPNWEVMEFIYDPWSMEQLAQELSDEGLNTVLFPQTDQRMIPASEDLWNAIARDNLLLHPNDPVLTKHVMAGIVDETGRGWRINKRKTKKPIDGLVAMLMAVHRALHYHRQGTPSVSVV